MGEGKRGPRGPRANRRLLALLVAIALAAALLAGAAGFSVVIQQGEVEGNTARVSDLDRVVAALAKENRERRAQDCFLFERDFVSAVNTAESLHTRYTNTVEYLRGLKPSARDDDLTAAVLRNLPASYAEAVNAWRDADVSRAPRYCDGKTGPRRKRRDVGLPETGRFNPSLSEKPEMLRLPGWSTEPPSR